MQFVTLLKQEIAVRNSALCFWLLISATGVCGAQPLRLGVLVSAPQDASEQLIDSFQRETERLVGFPGITLVWSRLEDNDGSQVYDRLVVVRIRGACRLKDGERPAYRGPLGITHISEGRILPFVDLDCERVKSILAAGTFARMFPVTHYALGRAMGRVAAHELYHVLAESQEHAEAGIAKASLSSSELLSDRMEFSEASLNRMRIRLRAAAPATVAASFIGTH